MPAKIPRLLWLVVPLAWVVYFYGLSAAGLFGPDEPRYASIGREMARSGDWVTPRLWGEAWFEKPALLYWLTAAAYKLGLGPETAPRLPIAVLSCAFLGFFWWFLRREFGDRIAWFACLVLGSTVSWIVFSQAGVTDLPLAAAFSASMLLALPWVARRDIRYLPAAAALLGFAVLAKGLLPIVLAAPLALRFKYWRDLVRPRVLLPFFVVALPWYAACYLRNGREFIDVFFLQHQFGRFVSGALQHVQPWWFYLPVLAGLVLPWTPLLLLLARRSLYRDPRCAFLLAWVLFGFVFFSAATNKLPGYLLPLIPAISALVAIALDQANRPRLLLAASALLLAVFPIAAPVLPAALAGGLSHAPSPAFHPSCLLPIVAAGGAWILESRARRIEAAFVIAAGCAAGIGYLKIRTLPEVDHLASARALARQIAASHLSVCADPIRRDWRYGLNYYTVVPVPACPAAAPGARIVQETGETPHLVLTGPR